MKDYFGYKGKTCVVTGSASGMGKATTEMLVDLGAKVYAMDLQEVEIEGIEKFIKVDLSKKESIDEAFSQLPEQFDKFFGCAGVYGARFGFLTTVVVDFVSYKYITQEYLSKRIVDGGAVGFITSNNGRRWQEERHMNQYLDVVKAEGWDATIQAMIDSGLSENTWLDGYNFSKRCMNYFACEAAYELGKREIRVNYILPGPTSTSMLKKSMEGDISFTNETLVKNVLVNATRIAEPREMAEPLVFLCSDLASFVSGVGIYVDFGLDAFITLGYSKDVIHEGEQLLKRNY